MFKGGFNEYFERTVCSAKRPGKCHYRQQQYLAKAMHQLRMRATKDRDFLPGPE